MAVSINNMSILDAALHYALQGFKVFPVHGMVNGKCTCGHPACKPPNSGKHPATANGVKAATSDPEQIKKWFTGTNWNVAIRTGTESRIWVLDIDGAQGEESLGALVAANGALPVTMESTTGRGRHLIFKHTGEELKNSASKIGLKIDSRGDNGYIVAPPSRHYSGAVYSLNDGELSYAPDWLEAMARGEKKREGKNYEMPREDLRPTDWTVADVRDMLASIDADMEYMEWVRVGMALHEGGFSVVLWDEWSKRGTKYQQGDCVKRWRGFKPGGGVSMGTLVEKAIESGWKRAAPEHDAVAAAYAARLHAAFLKKQKEKDQAHTAERPESKSPPDIEIKEEQPIEETSGFPDPLAIPGLIGETVKWIVGTSVKPQPELALLNVIAALGSVFGRRYKGQGKLDTRTNIYTIGLAPTGSGKDHSRKQVGVIMNQAGLSDYIGASRFVSDAGLVTALQKKTSQVMQIDEIGLVLQSIADPKAAGYTKNIATHLLTLYSASGGVFNGGQYADKEKEEIIIPSPNLCIYGTTTRDNYTKALTSASILSGDLNRFIIIPVKCDIPPRNENDDNETTPPNALLTAWEELKPTGEMAALNISTVNPNPTVVLWSKDIAIRMKNMGDIEDQKMRENENNAGALWNRYRENVIKIAMIFAITRNQNRPEIISADIDIAEGIVRRSVEYSIELCRDSVADSEFQRNCQKVLAYLRRNGLVTQTQLTNNMRALKPKEVKEVLESLEEQDVIEIGFDKNNPLQKKKTKIIRLKENAA